MGEVNNAFVVVMGITTVFVGLILIILFCKIVGLFFKNAGKKESNDKTVNTNTVQNTKIENREEILAAVCAACAEDMGVDVNALRVKSFKKI